MSFFPVIVRVSGSLWKVGTLVAFGICRTGFYTSVEGAPASSGDRQERRWRS